MSGLPDALTDAVLALPDAARAELARQLLASLDPAPPAEHQAAWLEIAHRRAAEIAQGKAECVSMEDALRRARESQGKATAK